MTTSDLIFEYTNWRGETAVRTVTPRGFRFGSSMWHSEQWLMIAFDHDKGAVREFALADCRFGGTKP